MINKKVLILATVLFALVGCGKTTIESSIRKDDKIIALSRAYTIKKINFQKVEWL